MPLFPKAKTGSAVAIEIGDALLVQDEAGHELGRLDRLASIVCELADGATPVATIAAAASGRLGRVVDAEAVWSALDRLADFGLLEQRVTPPASGARMPRRGLLSLGFGVGTAAVTLVRPATAANEEQNQKSSEQSYKRQQQEVASKRDFQARAEQQRMQASQRMESESKGSRQEASYKRQGQMQQQQQRAESGNKQTFEQGMKNQQRSQEYGSKEANSKRSQAQEQSSKRSR